MQFFTSKSDQNGPTWAQLGPKLGSSWAQKSIKNWFEKDLDKEAPLQTFNFSKLLQLEPKAVPGRQLKPNKGSKFAYEGSKFVYRGSKLAPKPSQIQAFWNDKRSSR